MNTLTAEERNEERLRTASGGALYYAGVSGVIALVCLVGSGLPFVGPLAAPLLWLSLGLRAFFFWGMRSLGQQLQSQWIKVSATVLALDYGLLLVVNILSFAELMPFPAMKASPSFFKTSAIVMLLYSSLQQMLALPLGIGLVREQGPLGSLAKWSGMVLIVLGVVSITNSVGLLSLPKLYIVVGGPVYILANSIDILGNVLLIVLLFQIVGEEAPQRSAEAH